MRGTDTEAVVAVVGDVEWKNGVGSAWYRKEVVGRCWRRRVC